MYEFLYVKLIFYSIRSILLYESSVEIYQTFFLLHLVYFDTLPFCFWLISEVGIHDLIY